jgi:hypothetical protein
MRFQALWVNCIQFVQQPHYGMRPDAFAQLQPRDVAVHCVAFVKANF